jgi:hypothetical protein
MFTRTRSKRRRSGDAPFCRFCGAEVRVDLLGQCRLGHQTVDVPLSTTSGPEPLDAPAVDDVDDASLVGTAVAEPLADHAEAPFDDAVPPWAGETLLHSAEYEDLYGADTHWVDEPVTASRGGAAEPLEEATVPATEGLWSAPTFGLETPSEVPDPEAPVSRDHPGAPAASWQDDVARHDAADVNPRDERGTDEPVTDEPGPDEPATDEPMGVAALATAAGGVAADAARQRLLEAASWFAASGDDSTR